MNTNFLQQSEHSTRFVHLEQAARCIRRDIVRLCYETGPERKGHPGPALSCADLVAALFFDVMNVRPAEPRWPDRDRFILSKGHASPVLYAALVNRGFFPREALASFRRVDGMLQGHPDMKGTPGVDMTTGSLGHGLSAGVGMCLAARMDHQNYHVYVLLGDGECQEGLVWEAAMAAARYQLDHLIAIVDCNGLQSCDTVAATMPLEPLVAKWNSFGWHTIEIDGHNGRQILPALDLAACLSGKPTVILARTVKGKGVSFMENDNSWHQRTLSREQYDQAVRELADAGEV